MNVSTILTVQDFTTKARVKAYVGSDSCAKDALLDTMIQGVSSRFVRFLGLHALEADRTEVYELRQHKHILTLDAKPIDTVATFEITHASSRDFTNLGVVASTLYSVVSNEGWVRLDFKTSFPTNYLQVRYTGGLGTSTADLATNFPDLAHAADLQVQYLMDRHRTLGGNVDTIVGGTSYTGEYGLLKEVRAILEMHRRVAV